MYADEWMDFFGHCFVKSSSHSGGDLTRELAPVLCGRAYPDPIPATYESIFFNMRSDFSGEIQPLALPERYYSKSGFRTIEEP
jgi:hypothetical protein